MNRCNVGLDVRVVDTDFSSGLLKGGQDKMKSFANIHLVEPDAGYLQDNHAPRGI